ncbi:MAG: copper amine oxidase N-terminal domain-containing protein [Alphaproteobacteria bacterium]|nr:copper amine oxidase N-terminal domain-containing protein [Alphaproteobacteria bacterium]
MKRHSGAVALFLAIILTFSMSVPAFAAYDMDAREQELKAQLEKYETELDTFPDTVYISGAAETLADGTKVIISWYSRVIYEVLVHSNDAVYNLVSSRGFKLDGYSYTYKVVTAAPAREVWLIREIRKINKELEDISDKRDDIFADEISRVGTVINAYKKVIGNANFVLQIGSNVLGYDDNHIDSHGIPRFWDYIDPNNRNVTPIIRNETTMIPVRVMVEAFGGAVNYDATTKTVTCTYEDTVVTMVINSKTAVVNGTATEITEPATVINGRTMIPLRFLAEAFGAEVEWTGVDGIIKVWRPSDDPFASSRYYDQRTGISRIHDKELSYYYDCKQSTTITVGTGIFDGREFPTRTISPGGNYSYLTLFCLDADDTVSGYEFSVIYGKNSANSVFEDATVYEKDFTTIIIPLELRDPDTDTAVSRVIVEYTDTDHGWAASLNINGFLSSRLRTVFYDFISSLSFTNDGVYED